MGTLPQVSTQAGIASISLRSRPLSWVDPSIPSGPKPQVFCPLGWLCRWTETQQSGSGVTMCDLRLVPSGSGLRLLSTPPAAFLEPTVPRWF